MRVEMKLSKGLVMVHVTLNGEMTIVEELVKVVKEFAEGKGLKVY